MTLPGSSLGLLTRITAVISYQARCLAPGVATSLVGCNRNLSRPRIRMLNVPPCLPCFRTVSHLELLASQGLDCFEDAVCQSTGPCPACVYPRIPPRIRRPSTLVRDAGSVCCRPIREVCSKHVRPEAWPTARVVLSMVLFPVLRCNSFERQAFSRNRDPLQYQFPKILTGPLFWWTLFL